MLEITTLSTIAKEDEAQLMAHTISYSLLSHPEARATTTPAQPTTSHAWFHARQAVSDIAGELIAGAALTAVLLVWTGWLL